MLRYLVELLKGFLLEFRGAKVCRVVLEAEGPRLFGCEFVWDVRVVEGSMRANVFDLEEEESQPVVREGCFQVKIEAGALTPPPLATNAEGFLPLLKYPEVFHQPVITKSLVRGTNGMEVRILSNSSLPPLWKRRVRREGKVERGKTERALRVLHETIKKEEIRSITFLGYFRNVPYGTIKIVGSDLIVDVIKGDIKSRDLFVFKVHTKDNRTKHVFISLS